MLLIQTHLPRWYVGMYRREFKVQYSYAGEALTGHVLVLNAGPVTLVHIPNKVAPVVSRAIFGAINDAGWLEENQPWLNAQHQRIREDLEASYANSYSQQLQRNEQETAKLRDRNSDLQNDLLAAKRLLSQHLRDELEAQEREKHNG